MKKVNNTSKLRIVNILQKRLFTLVKQSATILKKMKEIDESIEIIAREISRQSK
jgi:hypothetical protein